MQLQRNDLPLAFEAAGAGDPPLLLIHGWGASRGVFAPLIHATSGAHRVVAVDLPGHGESDAPAQEPSVEAFADDVARVMSALGLDRPVLIGHSLGGLVALELAARGLARALVVLESPVAAPPAMATALRPALDRLETDAYQTTAAALLERMLGERFDPDDRARMLADIRRVPQRVLAGSLRAALTYDSRTAAPRVRCPLLYVGTSTPHADLPRLRESCPQLVVGQLVACGHYFPLEVPDQLHPMIRRFLAVALG